MKNSNSPIGNFFLSFCPFYTFCISIFFILISLIPLQHTTQTLMPPAGFEPAIPANAQPQTFALDLSTNETSSNPRPSGLPQPTVPLRARNTGSFAFDELYSVLLLTSWSQLTPHLAISSFIIRLLILIPMGFHSVIFSLFFSPSCQDVPTILLSVFLAINYFVSCH